MVSKRKTVLIVDDEQNVRRLLRSMLGKEYNVVEAEDGEAAIHMAKRDKPDFILMDLMMPKMDGYSACKVIKATAITKGIPIVMLTAVGYELNVELSHEMGAAGYMTKPFTRQDLLDMVDRFLRSP